MMLIIKRLFIFFVFSAVLTSCLEPGNFNLKQFSHARKCDFSPFIKAGNVRLHRRKKAVFYVAEELREIAKEAADLLSEHIGIELFEIKDIYDPGTGSEIYIESDKSLYEQMKRTLEPNSNFIAYCQVKENYNKDTGEIFDSDIVFNPILYDRERYSLKIQKKQVKATARELRDRVRNAADRARASCNVYINNEQREACYRRVDNIEEDQEDRIDEREESYEDDFDDWKKNIYKAALRTMIHEMGHALGYQHTPRDIENIMYNNDRYKGGILTGRQVNAVLCAFSLPSDQPLFTRY